MRTHVAVPIFGFLILQASWSAAQDRVRVDVSAGQQATATQFRQAGTFEEFLENASFNVANEVKKDAFYDVAFNVRLWRGLSAGLAVSYFTKADDAAVEASIPHPFFFDRPRSIGGPGAGLKRTETGVHILVAWIVPATDRFELTFSGGPSVFQVQQDLVQRVSYSQSYPYDAAQFTGVAAQRIKDDAVGGNVGADVTWKLSRHVGIGAAIRYSHATFDTSIVSSEPTSFDVGGLHAGGGLRFIF
jgi:hypothetical protein